MKDIEVMLGFKMLFVWKVLWLAISPLVLVVSFIEIKNDTKQNI